MLTVRRKPQQLVNSLSSLSGDRCVCVPPLLRLLALWCGLAFLQGCAERVWNRPMATPAVTSAQAGAPLNDRRGSEDPYDFRHRLPKSNSKELFVILAFSGGGIRASAFAYGMLEALRDTTIVINGKRRRLLDEVDVITSVSGGSYTAAYYGLFGDRIFKDFERKFLKRDIRSVLFRSLFTPKHAYSLVHPELNRGDLAAQWIGKNLFENKTFRDMSRGRLPFVIVNASDLNTGLTFSFIQQQFDFLCSNILDYPVASAVVASSAIPIVMGPITVRNYQQNCPERQRPWIDTALRNRNFKSREYQVARALKRYQNPKQLPLVRLMDGGITDNLAVRGSVLSPIAHYGDVPKMSGAFTSRSTRRLRTVLTIVVNAQVYQPYRWSTSGRHPNALQVLRSSFDAAIDILNTEAATLASLEMRRWIRRVNRGRRPGEPKVRSYFSLITLDQIQDPKRKRWFNAIPTSATISDEQVDQVRLLAGELLRQQPKFKRFLKRFDGRIGKR